MANFILVFSVIDRLLGWFHWPNENRQLTLIGALIV